MNSTATLDRSATANDLRDLLDILLDVRPNVTRESVEEYMDMLRGVAQQG